jgi:hypothetical protein
VFELALRICRKRVWPQVIDYTLPPKMREITLLVQPEEEVENDEA